MQERGEVLEKDKWDIESIFQTDGLWDQNYNLVMEEVSVLNDFKGVLTTNSETLRVALDVYFDIGSKINKLYTYAHMRKDEDTKNELYLQLYEKAYRLLVDYDELSSYIKPEILSISESQFNVLKNSCKLSPYRFYLESIYRYKPHTLSEDEERLLSMAGLVMNSGSEIFRAINDSDIQFDSVKNNSELLELSHGSYYRFLLDNKRQVRKDAFENYHGSFAKLPNTFSTVLNSQIKVFDFNSKIRKFNSSLEASLFQHDIPVSIYQNLIDSVRKNIGVLHNYLEYRKECMGLEFLRPYDLYVPFVEHEKEDIDYSRAKQIVLESVKPLGNEYYEILNKGLNELRWVDIYENLNKRSGAYSTGSYLTEPFILMNYNNTINDVKTLAHEAGHSMHSYYTKNNQPSHYADYSIFLAEIASTFNENLLNHYMLNITSDKKLKRFLINNRIEEIRATFFRQTMFAEFELFIHNLVHAGSPLTPNILNDEYRRLNEFYFGKSVVVGKELEIEWARIPHFYYNFYVYQYATGISASRALFDMVINGGADQRERYLTFLKAGNSNTPIEILKNAGVDMTQSKPYEDMCIH